MCSELQLCVGCQNHGWPTLSPAPEHILCRDRTLKLLLLRCVGKQVDVSMGILPDQYVKTDKTAVSVHYVHWVCDSDSTVSPDSLLLDASFRSCLFFVVIIHKIRSIRSLIILTIVPARSFLWELNLDCDIEPSYFYNWICFVTTGLYCHLLDFELYGIYCVMAKCSILQTLKVIWIYM